MLVKLVLISDTYCILIKMGPNLPPPESFIREEFYEVLTRMSCHVTNHSQVPAQTLGEFRVNSVHGPWRCPRVSLFLFSGVAIEV